MMKKLVILFIIPLLLVSSPSYAQEVSIDSYSYSDQLKAGDEYKWSVSASDFLQEEFFTDGSEVTLKVLQDLAGVTFDGNISESAISSYFDVTVDATAFDLNKIELNNLLVFPDSITLTNGTSIDPFEGLWINEISDVLDLTPTTDVTYTISKLGDMVEFQAEVKVVENSITATVKFNATVNSNTGIMQKYDVLLKLPFGEDQTVHMVLKTDSTSEDTETEASEDEPIPINPMWILPILILPLIRRKLRKN